MQILIFRLLPYFVGALWLAISAAIVRGAALYIQQFGAFSYFAWALAAALLTINISAAYFTETMFRRKAWLSGVGGLLLVAGFTAASTSTFVQSLQQQLVKTQGVQSTAELTTLQAQQTMYQTRAAEAADLVRVRKAALLQAGEDYTTALAKCAARPKGKSWCESQAMKVKTSAETSVNALLADAEGAQSSALLDYKRASEALTNTVKGAEVVTLKAFTYILAALPDVLSPTLALLWGWLVRTNPQRINDLEKVQRPYRGRTEGVQREYTAILAHAQHIESTEGSIKSATEAATLRSKLQILTADLLHGKVALESSGFLSVAKMAKVYNLNPRTITKVMEGIAKEYPDVLTYEVNSRDSKLWKYKPANLGKFQLVSADGGLQPLRKFRR
jgi:hypothetical protein